MSIQTHAQHHLSNVDIVTSGLTLYYDFSNTMCLNLPDGNVPIGTVITDLSQLTPANSTVLNANASKLNGGLVLAPTTMVLQQSTNFRQVFNITSNTVEFVVKTYGTTVDNGFFYTSYNSQQTPNFIAKRDSSLKLSTYSNLRSPQYISYNRYMNVEQKYHVLS